MSWRNTYTFISNDRAEMEKLLVYMKHPKMPNEAWEMLSKWWRSLEGQVQSASMKEL